MNESYVQKQKKDFDVCWAEPHRITYKLIFFLANLIGKSVYFWIPVIQFCQPAILRGFISY
jgi:hypothetical protein